MNGVKNALAASRLHRSVVEARLDGCTWPRHSFAYDVVEVLGGDSYVSVRATGHWDLKVLQPIDVRSGLDLSKPWFHDWLRRTLARCPARLVVIEIPWPSYRQLDTHRGGDDPYYGEEKKYRDLVRDVIADQRGRGGHVLAEIHGGGHTDEHETATTFVKQGFAARPLEVKFVATHPELVEHLEGYCRQEQPATMVYPPDLGDAICRSYLDMIAAEDYASRATWQTSLPRAVYYVDVTRTEADWREVMEHVKELLGRKTQASMHVHPETELYRKIEALVPWQLLFVQVAHLPKAKRVRPGLEECHRASILLLNDDSITIETEFLRDAQAPRERFITPVRYGVFVLGHAPGEPQQPAAAQPPPLQPAEEGVAVKDDAQDALVEEGLVRQDFAGECWIIGGPLKPKEKILAKALVRMHRNLGHPRTEDLVRALNQDPKVSAEAVALARRLRCATCERTRRPLPPRPTSLRAAGPFNSKVMLDFVYLHDAKGDGHNFLHVLEPNGNYNLFQPVESRQPEHVFEKFCDMWASWAGFPEMIFADQDGAFEGVFAEKMKNVGTDIDHNAGEAHWQTGAVEAYNRAFRYVAARLVDEHQLEGEIDMKLLGAQVSASLNDKVRTCGCSPNEWLFGRSPKKPTDLLSPDGKLQALQGLDLDQELRRRHYVRAQADSRIAEFMVNDALRKAVLRLDHPGRDSYEPELVAFWREAKTRRDAKTKKVRRLPAAWFRGTVIGPHKGDHSQSNYWIASAGRCILAAKEQMRPAYGTELWRIQDEVLQGILDNPPEDYVDERGPPPAEGEAQSPGEVIPLYDETGDYEEDEPLPHPAAGVGEVEGGEPRPLRPDHVPHPPPGEDEPRELQHDPPQDRGHERERSPRRTTADVPPESSVGTDVTQPSPTSFTRPVGLEEAGGLHPEAPEAKRVRLAEEPDDAVEEHGVNYNSLYVPVTEQEYYAGAPPDFLSAAMFHRNTGATRKEQKALEKEIPYHMIPEHQREEYAAALVKEWDTWQKYGATDTLDLEASQAAEAEYPKERFLDTRVCYRNKNAGYPWLPLKAKARLVCRGDRDPDLLELRRDAPTLTRMGLLLILQIAAAHAEWFLWVADITGAFLQGNQEMASRSMPLFLRQPKEGLPGLAAGQLLLVVRGIFGLANSPRLFWRFLRDSLIGLGFVQSSLDKALFCYYQAGKLILILGTHVDDLIGTGEPVKADKILEKVKATFDFGAWSDSRTEGELEYGGKQISKDDKGVVTLTQEKFARAITVTPVPKWRTLSPQAVLTAAETTELKSAGGCLHWMVGQTRPDLAAATSLSMSGTPTVHNLVEINKVLKEAKNTTDWGLRFVPLDLAKAKIVVFTDASWANTESLRSQAGFLTFLCGEDVFSLKGDSANLLDWRSHRIQRQCRSTLAAETMAMDAGFDSGIFLRELLAEAMIESYSPVQSGSLPKTFLPTHPVTDCRSLYDLLTKDGPVASTQEKRLTIDVEAIKQSAEEFDPKAEDLRSTFKWVDTLHQLADHLTKIKPAYQLRELLGKSHLALQAKGLNSPAPAHDQMFAHSRDKGGRLKLSGKQCSVQRTGVRDIPQNFAHLLINCLLCFRPVAQIGGAVALCSTAFVAPTAQTKSLRATRVAEAASVQPAVRASSSSALSVGLGATSAALALGAMSQRVVFKGTPQQRTVALKAFESELGVQDPVGFWDPAGFTADGSVENFKRRRQTELKHGRISMLATMGYITPEITGKFPGYLSPSAGLKFADVPNGLAAISKVPAA
ncbi:unnamed protein product [Symbiodinium microadriaticum]|nr:unnamed protein product [Symbiodinium microadriaticum]